MECPLAANAEAEFSAPLIVITVLICSPSGQMQVSAPDRTGTRRAVLFVTQRNEQQISIG
jgi:hypothetical protein